MPTSPRFSLDLSLIAVFPHHLNSCPPLLKGRMTMWMVSSFEFLGLLSFLLLQPIATSVPIGTNLGLSIVRKPSPHFPIFIEAPAFRNGDECKAPDIDQVHIAMTLDSNYLRGTIAAVLSILQHTSCPENVVFHFLSANDGPNLSTTIKTTFPYLNFKVYRFESRRVKGRISKSIRQALDQPLNYARIYLSDIIQSDIARIIYLDSDVLVVNDIRKLWAVNLGDKVVAAPEYCHANFTKYFTDSFWFDSELSKTFHGRNPCYFNTGVMVLDVEKWRTGGYTSRVEYWMGVQKRTRIYHLGSLPPFLLVLAGNIKNIDHRWNQHGLGGDNIEGKCRKLHRGRVSLLHWSGKGKPWLRLDSRKPCVVDRLWAPYDLYRSSSSLEE